MVSLAAATRYSWALDLTAGPIAVQETVDRLEN